MLIVESPCEQAVKRTRKGAGPLAAVQQQENVQVAETPAVATARARGVPFTPAAPATAMRVPVLGETFYSQKGTLCTLCTLCPVTLISASTAKEAVARASRDQTACPRRFTCPPGG